jgi:hypothetical protein
MPCKCSDDNEFLDSMPSQVVFVVFYTHRSCEHSTHVQNVWVDIRAIL